MSGGGKRRRQARLWQRTRWWAERRRGRLRGVDAAEVGDVKGRSQKVARLQASRVAGLIHCRRLECLYVSISWFRLVP